MADIVKIFEFRVSYKFPKQKIVNMTYQSPSLAHLMRNLQISEGVNRDTVEFLIVHQILPDGKVLELVEVDPAQNKNVVHIASVKKQNVKPLVRDWEDEWGDGEDEEIINEVTQLLTRAASSKKLVPGFHFRARAAQC